MKRSIAGKLTGAALLAMLWGVAMAAGPGAGEGAMHHPDMKGAQAQFHELMEPIWHTAPGPQRTARACGKAKDIGARVVAMGRERGPTAVLDRMAETSKRVGPACASGRAAEVDEVLDQLHAQFHELMGMH